MFQSPVACRRSTCAVRRAPSTECRAPCALHHATLPLPFPCNCRCRFRCRCPCHYRSRFPCPCSCLCVCLCLYCPFPCPCICPCPCLCLSAHVPVLPFPCPCLCSSFCYFFANKTYINSNLKIQFPVIYNSKAGTPFGYISL